MFWNDETSVKKEAATNSVLEKFVRPPHSASGAKLGRLAHLGFNLNVTVKIPQIPGSGDKRDVSGDEPLLAAAAAASFSRSHRVRVQTFSRPLNGAFVLKHLIKKWKKKKG